MRSVVVLAPIMSIRRSHPEDADLRLREGRGGGGRGGEPENRSRLPHVAAPVVPEPRRGVIGMSLALVLVANGLRDRPGVLARKLLVPARELVPLHRDQNRCRLLSSHDRDAARGPGPEEPRIGGGGPPPRSPTARAPPRGS